MTERLSIPGVVKQRYEPAFPIRDLTPHPRNSNRGNLDLLAESFGANGFYGALVVQESTRYILAGEWRWRTAKDRGLKKLPVLFVDVPDDVALRILLVDNRANRRGRDEEQELAALLQELERFEGEGFDGEPLEGLHGTGFDSGDLEWLLAQAKQEAEEGDGEQEPPPQKGRSGPDPTASYFQIGPHKWSIPRSVFDEWLEGFLEECGGDAGLRDAVMKRLGIPYQADS